MADITITVPDNQVNRVRSAFAFALELGSPPAVTLSDVKNYIITDLKQFVKTAENRKAAKENKITNEVDFT